MRLQAATAYLESLQALQPPLTPLSSFEAAAPLVPESADYAVLSERRREQIFMAYVTALDKAERAARSKAQAAFQVRGGGPSARMQALGHRSRRGTRSWCMGDCVRVLAALLTACRSRAAGRGICWCAARAALHTRAPAFHACLLTGRVLRPTRLLLFP